MSRKIRLTVELDKDSLMDYLSNYYSEDELNHMDIAYEATTALGGILDDYFYGGYEILANYDENDYRSEIEDGLVIINNCDDYDDYEDFEEDEY